jgi:hypothetical protein
MVLSPKRRLQQYASNASKECHHCSSHPVLSFLADFLNSLEQKTIANRTTEGF